MLRVGVLIWILVAIVLAGSFVTVVLLIPQLELRSMEYIPIAAILGAVIAIIPSWMIAKSLVNKLP